MTAIAQPSPSHTTTKRLTAERFAATNDAAERFFGAHADAIAQACRAMAERFQRGGRLLVCGDGAQRSDVAHIVVEFLHPVVVGKRALPAMALPCVSDGSARHALATLGQRDDIVIVIAATAVDGSAHDVLAHARERGMLTIALAGSARGPASADHVFAVPSADPCIVQETHEMLYHVLWELVHVFFDHRQVKT